MKTITVRQLLREFNSLFPLPIEGVEVKRKEGNFFLFPVATINEIDRIRKELDSGPTTIYRPATKEEMKNVEFNKKGEIVMTAQKEMKMICPKHGGQRMGIGYTCCDGRS